MSRAARIRAQHGFALIELLLVMSLSLVLLSATLFTFERLISNEDESDKRQDAVELARRTLDQESRQLRNLAKRINNVAVIDTVQPYDFIFQTSDPSRTWVRYCLDVSQGDSRGRLYEQTQSLPLTTAGSPVTDPMRTGCPSTSGWTTAGVVADHVVNRIGGRTNHPLFSFRCTDGTSSCTSSPATFDKIVGVDHKVIINTTPDRLTEEIPVSSSVYLRNQNQAPVAAISSHTVASPARTIILNAAGTTDFENRTLQYFWFLNTMPTTSQIDCAAVAEKNNVPLGSTTPLWGSSGYIGRGITLQYTFPSTGPASGTGQTIGLVACDPGDRYDTAGIAPEPPFTVIIP